MPDSIAAPARPLPVLFADPLSRRVNFLHELVPGEHPDRPLPVLYRASGVPRLNQLGDRPFQRRNPFFDAISAASLAAASAIERVAGFASRLRRVLVADL
jgi:hypothetical protein